jgi:hypothetical protein
VESAADLNARADAVAALYVEVALLTSDALTGTNVADGGDPQAVTYTPAGDEGPTSDHAPIDGLAWSGVNDFTLTEVATHLGLLVGGVVVRTVELPTRVGPGPVPFVHGIGPAGL